jgi:hypothetical protein
MNPMNRVLAFAAVAEAATGVALMVVPSLVTDLLLGAEVTGTGVVAARVAGFALIGLGAACWPGGVTQALCGMLTYSSLTTGYLAYLGLGGVWVGPLLWPAAVLHAVLTALLTCGWLVARKAVTQNDV